MQGGAFSSHMRGVVGMGAGGETSPSPQGALAGFGMDAPCFGLMRPMSVSATAARMGLQPPPGPLAAPSCSERPAEWYREARWGSSAPELESRVCAPVGDAGEGACLTRREAFQAAGPRPCAHPGLGPQGLLVRRPFSSCCLFLSHEGALTRAAALFPAPCTSHPSQTWAWAAVSLCGAAVPALG